MKILLPTLFLFIGFFSSCTSEYEERLVEGQELIDRIEILESSQLELSDKMIKDEMIDIKNEIITLAKLSGNEELFLIQLKGL